MVEDTNKSFFVINEDGSITRNVVAFSNSSGDVGNRLTRPSIMKFYVSHDEARCGDTIHVAWATIDADGVVITISQGGKTASEVMPPDGELDIKSNLSDEDITITISVQNSIGKTSSRKMVIMSKRENIVETNVGATVFQVAVIVLFIIVILLKLFA